MGWFKGVLVGEFSWSWRIAGSDFKYVKWADPVGVVLRKMLLNRLVNQNAETHRSVAV